MEVHPKPMKGETETHNPLMVTNKDYFKDVCIQNKVTCVQSVQNELNNYGLFAMK